MATNENQTGKVLPDRFGEGDTYLVRDILPPELAENVSEKLKVEVKWNTMVHRGGEVPRLVAVEGEILDDGSYLIYRHPADSSPPLHAFSPTVESIRQHIARFLNQPLNHVLIQHYRHGGDYISEHSDKTIDVVHGSNIVNVSIGAQRVMTLRTKKDAAIARASGAGDTEGPVSRSTQRIPLPHNSMLVMGLETNAKWLHGIRTDKRPIQTKSSAEQAFNGERISLTFRHIGTYLTADSSHIFGQGATGRTREKARPVVNGGEDAERLIVAFGEENHKSDFNWDLVYGQGSDVLHFTPP